MISIPNSISIIDLFSKDSLDISKTLSCLEFYEATTKDNVATALEFALIVKNDQEDSKLFDVLPIGTLNLSLHAPFYMEGYQMLSQTSGTVANPIKVGRIDEVKDYQLYKSLANSLNENKNVVCGSNYFMVKEDDSWYLIGATSAFHSDLMFSLNSENGEISIYWDLGHITIEGKTCYKSDYICFLKGSSREDVLNLFGELIRKHHEITLLPTKTGWCSWYCYYANVTEQIVKDNLDLMDRDLPECEYIQIDDGFQTHMGDWLEESEKFNSGLKALCDEIRAKGKKPAIWVAPFIADGNSKIFKENPSWFIKDENGNPLKAENVTYGGWRETPWYLLDMSIHAVRNRIKHIFKVLKRDYGIDYFKLDACYWGAIKGLKYKHHISAVSHYRLGLFAIRKAVGNDSYILGCNAPLWPSIGLVNAQRVTDDVERSVHRINQIFTEYKYRAWMSNVLWANDVDCLVTTSLPNASQHLDVGYYKILLAMSLTSGGPVILGDDLHNVNWNLTLNDTLGLTVKEVLKIAKSQDNNAAVFIGDDLNVARMKVYGKDVTIVFKSNDVEVTLS